MLNNISFNKHGKFYTVYINGREIITLEYTNLMDVFEHAIQYVEYEWDNAEEKNDDKKCFEFERTFTELEYIIETMKQEVNNG